MAEHPERDEITGRYTTGHEWDGISELNTPLPKWWVWVFYISIGWSVLYTIAYPSWPVMSGFFGGATGWHARASLEDSLAEAREARSEWVTQIAARDVPAILEDNTLRSYAMRGGEVLFKENCAPCHQTGGAGAYGYPTLADDEWIWGGTPEAIVTTIQHGIRNDTDPDARSSEMYAFGEWELLTEEEIDQVAQYVYDLSHGEMNAGPGQDIFVAQCAACHSPDAQSPGGEGNKDLGGPPLNNRIFLYGGTKKDIAAQVYKPQLGVMPSWSGRLSDEDIKQLAVYVHSLGGGQ
ncbi:cytochrome-c oxidase, cbb3-type subunit III [Roseospira marina]|uniref:Cbb3-type cytochrome c oxidase subunit n=1 Tax=Roseospira marina TaxID=140057 RepID=A0A5M6I5R3_9PROT|nr:cytochrome-c oxidase, cbb3-type subunit III [Roseospira marina]KAA5603473.1 cytochrome-c oxidase, cbb3-type subunit III [Roseospira marina]MBB4316146.1 cytochrome c oxidase cbb3-type subunit 3 [Roseospira marina]MBB5089350.1 cytochrome c oxidase cbb3-type subunit 3 [Roseospira marina]